MAWVEYILWSVYFSAILIVCFFCERYLMDRLGRLIVYYAVIFMWWIGAAGICFIGYRYGKTEVVFLATWAIVFSIYVITFPRRLHSHTSR